MQTEVAVTQSTKGNFEALRNPALYSELQARYPNGAGSCTSVNELTWRIAHMLREMIDLMEIKASLRLDFYSNISLHKLKNLILVVGDEIYLIAIKPHHGYARIGGRYINIYQSGAEMVVVNAIVDELEMLAPKIERPGVANG